MAEVRRRHSHIPQSTIYYNYREVHGNLSASGSARRPLSLFCPRQPRPSRISIIKLPVNHPNENPTIPETKLSRLCSELGKLASRQSVKRAFGCVLSTFSFWPSYPGSKTQTGNAESIDNTSTPARPQRRIVHEIGTTELDTVPRIAEDTMVSLVARSHHSIPSLLNPHSNGIGNPARNSTSSVSQKSLATASTKQFKSPKPIASSNNVSCSIQLAEPHVYLSGFDHDGRGNNTENSVAIIRGRLVLNVQKSTKIKAVTLSFYGKARTDWPEGIPPGKQHFFEEEKLRYQVLPFYNAQYSDSTVGYGAQCNYVLQSKQASSSTTSLNTVEFDNSLAPATRSSRSSTILSARDHKRLSLQTVQSRSFAKETPVQVNQQKGYKVFHPGTYEYSFEISLDHTCPETMDLPLGSVHWMLEALVERAGTFKPNLHGTKEIIVIRAPDQNSMEQVEPIAISRKWEDQLHYDIVISGKSFPIGSKIPIAFKLTPLAKVQCHRIKVYVTENIDYYCLDKKVTRRDAQRKILLFERNAGKPLAPDYESSEIRVLAGGELTEEQRERARAMAERRRLYEAQMTGSTPEPLPAPTANLLGDLDLGLEHLINQTEIEMEVQLPTCAMMKKDKTKLLHPDTTYKNIQVHHWIKIVMRLSRVDADDPTGTKRRHFEISIDSPFHILSCLATQAHTSLPSYSGPSNITPKTYECGCPNACVTDPDSRATSNSTLPTLAPPTLPTIPALGSDGNALPSLATPPQAHLPYGATGQRPIHLLRIPSYNPPAFGAEDPPPPLETPPPLYDNVIGTPSVDGLADYFARLANYDEGDGDTDEEDAVPRTTGRTGRVNVTNPRTPGQRGPSRSMEISREFMFRPEGFDRRLQAQAERGMGGVAE